MKHSEILRKAKRRLWNGRGEVPDCWFDRNSNFMNQFICNAVEDVAGDYELDWRISRDITNYIESLLCGMTVNQWLVEKGYVTYDGKGYEDFKQSTHVKIQKYRKAWMDHLIKHYEEQGL